jgi:hypothetical protein
MPHFLWFKKSIINLKSENSQDYAQKTQQNCTLMIWPQVSYLSRHFSFLLVSCPSCPFSCAGIPEILCQLPPCWSPLELSALLYNSISWSIYCLADMGSSSSSSNPQTLFRGGGDTISSAGPVLREQNVKTCLNRVVSRTHIPIPPDFFLYVHFASVSIQN